MLTLCATGKSSLDEVTGDDASSFPMYLWSYGNYKYEIEATKAPMMSSYFSSSEVLESSYEDALNKFENMVDKAVLV